MQTLLFALPTLLFALPTLLFASITAFAAPVVTIDGNGVVVGTTVVDAPLADVLAFVRDPKAIAALNADGTTVDVQPDGDCKQLQTTVPTTLKTVRFKARSCDTETGVRTELVSSPDFTQYEVQWDARATDAGTEITYRYRGVVSAPVPAFVVNRATRKAIERLFARITTHFAAPNP